MENFLTAEWRKLLMANYEVPAQLLQPYLPAHTELDTWRGKHYVSLVGFMFLNTKVLGVSFPFHTNFEEVNLRFYVRYKEQNTWKRGVVFIREIVPKHLISWVANTVYKENYATYPMQHTWKSTDNELLVRYEWQVEKTWNYLQVTAHPTPLPLVTGSKAEFITEHYWGYAKVNEQSSMEYEVRHPAWQIYSIKEFATYIDIAKVYGEPFYDYLNVAPASVFLAEGSEISVQRGRRVNK